VDVILLYMVNPEGEKTKYMHLAALKFLSYFFFCLLVV
jgi:hypothetical protein